MADDDQESILEKGAEIVETIGGPVGKAAVGVTRAALGCALVGSKDDDNE